MKLRTRRWCTRSILASFSPSLELLDGLSGLDECFKDRESERRLDEGVAFIDVGVTDDGIRASRERVGGALSAGIAQAALVGERRPYIVKAMHAQGSGWRAAGIVVDIHFLLLKSTIY